MSVRGPAGGARTGYLGLGSNLGDRHGHLVAALEGLGRGGAPVRRVSSLYETAPFGEYEGPQPDFLNAVAEISTELSPRELLELCKRLEHERGRDPSGPRHGPRPLDLDILLLGDLVVTAPGLRIPHPGIGERRFVLEPLLELAPGLELPDGEPLAPRLAACADQEVAAAGELSPPFHSAGRAAGA